jgi:rhamnosyltransferase
VIAWNRHSRGEPNVPENDDRTATGETVIRDVCAVVVTYHPQVEILNELLSSVSPQVGAVVVVDNGSPPEPLRRLQDANTDPRIAWLELGENIGVGAAHNLGIAWARRRGYSYVLLLDHDSIPAADMVDQLLVGYHNASQHHRVAAVGPAYRDPRTGTFGPFVRFGTFWNRHIPSRTDWQSVLPKSRSDEPIRSDFLISSGTLIPLSVIDAVGDMDDGLFVDYIDTEWSLRAASHGYRLYGIPAAVMEHTIGDRVRRIGPFRVHEYSSMRLYYNMRNRVLLARKPMSPLMSSIRSTLHALRLMLVYGLLIGPRWRNLWMLCRGLLDGLVGCVGRYDVARRPEEWQAVLDRAGRTEREAPRKAA